MNIYHIFAIVGIFIITFALMSFANSLLITVGVIDVEHFYHNVAVASVTAGLYFTYEMLTD